MTTDSEIDIFLEHFGVKGMKWGVRQEKKHQAQLKKYRAQGLTSRQARLKQVGVEALKGGARGLALSGAAAGWMYLQANPSALDRPISTIRHLNSPGAKFVRQMRRTNSKLPVSILTDKSDVIDTITSVRRRALG